MARTQCSSITALVFMLLASVASPAFAVDLGVFTHPLNHDRSLPDRAEAITADTAASAVRSYVETILSPDRDVAPALESYWSDYRQVVGRYRDLTEPKPVCITNAEGETRVARFLVGVRMAGMVGGFWAVNSRTGDIEADLMWTPELAPLWTVPEADWNSAASINDIEELAELLPPFTQFTTGIPVDPSDEGLTIIDGVVDALPLKTQEERRSRVAWFNETFGTDLQVALKSHKGRRTATSKCMSVAASYVGDWWTATTGRPLPVYTNGVGGQKEYGFNPRLLECLFYQNHKSAKPTIKWLGNWKFAPFSKDRVTGEAVPYSPRGYARILAETNAGTTPDNLVPTLLVYETRDNHFGMDQKPMVYQIFTSGYFPRKGIKDDIKDARDEDFPFSLAPNYGSPVDVEGIARALATYGPLLGQHMGRNDDGSPKNTTFGMGVHAVMVVGTGMVGGRPMLIYRETFGKAAPSYLEDSFLGPSFRAMPLDYFYQAIAFPHHLYVDVADVRYADDASLVGTVRVTTNRKQDAVGADAFHVFVDGRLAEHARFTSTAPGQYRMWLPISETAHGTRIEIRAIKRYFADAQGRNAFGTTIERPVKKWIPTGRQLSPTDIEAH